MSTDWGYICRADGSESGCFVTGRTETLRDIARAWLHIEAVLDAVPDAEIHYLGVYDSNEPSLHDWLREHAGHDVALVNEYGGVAALDSADPYGEAWDDYDRKQETRRAAPGVA